MDNELEKCRSSAAWRQAPKWLADRMTRLGTVMSEAIDHHYGCDEPPRRLCHRFWFQPSVR